MAQKHELSISRAYFADREVTTKHQLFLELLPEIRDLAADVCKHPGSGGLEEKDAFVFGYRSLRLMLGRQESFDADMMMSFITDRLQDDVESAPIGYSQSARSIHNVNEVLLNAFENLKEQGQEATPQECADWLGLSLSEYYRQCAEVSAAALVYESVEDPRPPNEEVDSLRRIRLSMWALLDSPGYLQVWLSDEIGVEPLVEILETLNAIHRLFTGTALTSPVVKIGLPKESAAPMKMLEPA